MNQNALNIIQAITSIVTAIGTIGAVILSLYFSIQNRLLRLKLSASVEYAPRDENNKLLGHTISKNDARLDEIKSHYRNFTEVVRLNATNEGNTDAYINGFYFKVGIFSTKLLSISHEKCTDGKDIRRCIHPGDDVTMLININILNSSYVKDYYKRLFFPRVQFRIAAKTVRGENFYNSVDRSSHEIIRNNMKQ